MALLWLFAATQIASARNVTLAWDPSADSSVAGYHVLYGRNTGVYTQALDVGRKTTATVADLTEGSTYYFVVTAYDTAAIQSAPSNEVGFRVAANLPPSVTLTSPTAGANYSARNVVTMSARASDPDGRVTRVEFYEGVNKLSETFGPLYSAVWANPVAGRYEISAIAYDNAGAAVRSSQVPITVLGSTRVAGRARPGRSRSSPARGKPD